MTFNTIFLKKLNKIWFNFNKIRKKLDKKNEIREFNFSSLKAYEMNLIKKTNQLKGRLKKNNIVVYTNEKDLFKNF